MNVGDLLETLRDLDDVVAQHACVGATADQFRRAMVGECGGGFWIWVPADTETWARAYAAYEAEAKLREAPRTPPRSEPRTVGTVEVGDF